MILTPSIFIYMCNICRDFNFDTDGHTDIRTDRVTYRDATHLKTT